MTDVRRPSGFQRRILRMGLLPGIAAIIISFIIEISLLTTLPVFRTSIGIWVLLSELLTSAALLLVLIIVGSVFFSGLEARRSSWQGWIVYYFILGLACFGVVALGLSEGLSIDVKYSTYISKASIDFLSLQYLDGRVVWTIFLLVALFLLSDPRVYFATGPEGKRHFYMHSKFLGLVRLLQRTNLGDFFQGRRRYYDPTQRPSLDWDIGETFDHAVLSKNGKLQWNDKYQVSSPSFLVWTAVKFLLAVPIATLIANDLALRLSLIQNYLDQTGDSWFGEIARYFGVFALRLEGTYQVSPSFGIETVFTVEVFGVILSLLGLAFTVTGIRLAISLLANAIVGLSKRSFGMSRQALSNFFAIISLVLLYAVLGAGVWVYDVGTPFILWTLLLLLIGSLSVTVFTRTQRIFHLSLTRLKAMGILVIVIVSVVALPAYASFLRGQSGQYLNYQWNPAYVPTIHYTQWSYAVDNVVPADISMITSNTTNTLDQIRIFTQDAAKGNMKPFVGVNWMSIANAPVDIIYLNGTEYWVSLLQLVQPTISADNDVWRTQHLLLTHSEKILSVNAATTQPVDIEKLWNLTQTPEIYYGEGGLWQSVDEVYLYIPGFGETHLANYTGPGAYAGPVDYTFSGFWRYWKFLWQGRLDFAGGNYGDIRALEFRDIDSRTSNALLPHMQTDPDPYPVVDPQGNIYLLHWVWIDWPSPSGYADYPEHNQTSILRLFSTVLTNVKTGEITGYLDNSRAPDYVTSFYGSMYPQWNKPIPSWLVPQLRYPETFFNTQQDVYNFYFQTDSNGWQRNFFLQSAEETRFIIIPINGVLTWAAVRLVEIYRSPAQNLAGLYVAPAGADTGKVYLIRFPEGITVIGPSSAENGVARTNPTVGQQITLHQGGANPWVSGNILLYSIKGRLIYVIPYYATQQSLTVPVMVVLVDAVTKQIGSHLIDPNRPNDVQQATMLAMNDLLGSSTQQSTINGTLTDNKPTFIKNGNTHWILTIRLADNSTILVDANAGSLAINDIIKINNTVLGGSISVVVDNTTYPPTVLSVL